MVVASMAILIMITNGKNHEGRKINTSRRDGDDNADHCQHHDHMGMISIILSIIVVVMMIVMAPTQ